MRSCCTPQSVPLCSQERRGVRDRSLRRTLSRGPFHPSSWLASSSPLFVSTVASRHLSPPDGLFRSSSLHLFSPYILLSFLSSFFWSPVCLPVPSLCSRPSLFLCVSDGQIDNGTATRSGVRAFPYQQHAWDSLHCLACFHMTPGKLK